MTGNPLETLDQWEMQMIAEFLSPFNTTLFRATCAHCRDRIPSISIVHQGREGKYSPDWLLTRSTRNAHRDLCVLAREWGATNLNKMLTDAVQYRNHDLCVLAHEWGLASRASLTLPNAQRVSSLDYNAMLMCATETNQRDFCKLARNWTRAESEGNADRSPGTSCPPPVCEAPSSTPLNFGEMLDIATRNDNRELCILAYNWGTASGISFNIDMVMATAVFYGYEDTRALAREWGSEFDEVLDKVSTERNQDIRDVASEWISDFYDNPDVP